MESFYGYNHKKYIYIFKEDNRLITEILKDNEKGQPFQSLLTLGHPLRCIDLQCLFSVENLYHFR